MIAFNKDYRANPEPKRTECLFIGGPLDGQRHLIEDHKAYFEAAVQDAVGRVFLHADRPWICTPLTSTGIG